jgi:hypothetical protein
MEAAKLHAGGWQRQGFDQPIRHKPRNVSIACARSQARISDQILQRRSADFQSAVSQNCILQTAGSSNAQDRIEAPPIQIAPSEFPQRLALHTCCLLPITIYSIAR